MRCLLSVLFCALLLFVSTSAAATLSNRFMEGRFDGNWFCQGGCTLEPSKTRFRGNLSVLIRDRTKTWNGLAQTANVVPNTRYMMSAYVRLQNLNDGRSMYETVELVMNCQNKQGEKTYQKFARDIYVRPRRWTKLSGINTIPEDATTCKMYVNVLGVAVNYFVDNVNLVVVRNAGKWLRMANKRIKKIRQNDVIIRLNGFGPGNYSVELIQKNHQFGFGSVVRAKEIVDPVYKAYQDVFYDLFEWGVLGNALKWRQMQRNEDAIDYDTPLTAVDALRRNKIKVRGHNVFWSDPIRIPDWVKVLNRTEVKQAITVRVNGVVNATKGKVLHWDVNNENLHFDWFEQATGDPYVTDKMFREVNRVDAGVKLFLNDYNVLDGNTAWPLRMQATRLLKTGVPIHAVGIQSHMNDGYPDLTEIKVNLDTVAAAKLPLWITELSIAENNATVKAKALRDLMTLYFSHPAVQGIILWGFWDGLIWKPSSALFHNDTVTPNEAGLVLQSLLKKVWRTNVFRKLADDGGFKVRGFKGQYVIRVKEDDERWTSAYFYLGGKAKKVVINSVNGSPVIKIE